MPARPIRCQRCGSVSVGGLLISGSVPFNEDRLPIEITNNPERCPLCKSIFNDDSRRVADALYSALREAKLDPAESKILVQILADHYKRRSAYADVVSEIEVRVPKAAGLNKHIPPAEVTGFLALIIATLTLAEQLAHDWFVPSTQTPEHRDTTHTAITGRQDCWIRFEYPAVTPTVHYHDPAYGPYFTLRGYWWTNDSRYLWLCTLGPSPPRRPNMMLRLSSEPGRWEYDFSIEDRGSWMLFICELGEQYDLGRQKVPLEREAMRKICATPFRFLRTASSIRLEQIPITDFIEWLNMAG